MSSMTTAAPVEEASIELTIIRKDGKRVNLGRVAYTHKNPVRSYLVNFYIRRKLARLRRIHNF